MNSSAPLHRSFQGKSGRNTIEARLVSSPRRELRWRFHFTASRYFVPGSFHVEAGQVLAVDASTIVFRLDGTAGERVKFSYLLAR